MTSSDETHRAGAGAPQRVLIEVLTKRGCHLCEQMSAVTTEVAGEFGLTVTEVDITDDAQMLAQFAEELPVLRLDGVVRDFWRVDPQRLRRLLRQR